MDAIWFTAAGFVLNVIGTIVGVTWLVSNRLRDHEATFMRAMTDHQISDNTQFAAVRAEISDSGDGVRREVGEANLALRQKMHDMETWNRDTFMRRQSFLEVTKEMSSDIKELIAKVTRIEAMQNGHKD